MKKSIVRKIGALGAFLILLLTVVTVQLNAPLATAQSAGEFASGIFVVIPDPAPTSVMPGKSVATTFYLQGKIYGFRTVNQADCSLIDADEPQLGTWHAWGEVAANGRLVIHHTFNLFALNGAFEAQGITGITMANGAATAVGATGSAATGPSEVLAIVGGSGTYKGLNGQVNIRPYCGPASLVNSPDPVSAFTYDRAFSVGIEQSKRNGR